MKLTQTFLGEILLKIDLIILIYKCNIKIVLRIPGNGYVDPSLSTAGINY